MPTEPSGPIVVPVAHQANRIYMLELDASGRLKVLIDAITAALSVTATDLDIRNLVKTQDELYAVLRTDAAAAYDARDRNWTVTETVPVTQTTPANLLGGIHGYDGAAWRKLPLLWGYTDTYLEVKSELNAVTGTNTLNASAVPTGELWVVTNFKLEDQTTAITSVHAQIYDGATAFTLAALLSPAINQSLERQGWWPLKAGQNFRSLYFGCAAGDDLYLTLSGFKMAVA